MRLQVVQSLVRIAPLESLKNFLKAGLPHHNDRAHARRQLRLGAVRLVSRAIYTNTAPNGAFRPCNGIYNTFALERHTDEICAAIGMDPHAFRRRNVLGDGDLGATGQVFEGDVLGPMLDPMTDLRGAALPDRRAAAIARCRRRSRPSGVTRSEHLSP
jgi:CO/xanthine dehydrogenase Mo-binding subunit